jgi:O-antigen ligase
LCTIAMTFSLINYRNPQRLALFSCCILLSIAIAYLLNPFLLIKFTTSFFTGAFDIANSGYITLWLSGIEVFKTSPFTGLGTSTYRYLCSPELFPTGFNFACNNHNHQIYIQTLAETGIFGFFAFVIMVASLIQKLMFDGIRSKDRLKKYCYIVPFAMFFPLQSTGDLFGQWTNAFIWFGIATALAYSGSRE